MNSSAIELVVKIGSMALIRKQDNDIDYNILSRLSSELKPGHVLVSSGATEIGRLDYIKRSGHELSGENDNIITDYAAQGQTILMSQYRQFIKPEYSVRQILVEHTHFNDADKREHIRQLLLRSAEQGAISIINYNDPVSAEENRKLELSALRENSGSVVECIDNDETAAVIAELTGAGILVILTSTEGIYRDAGDPSTLVEHVGGSSVEELEANIRALQESCVGSSRAGAQGARAKLEYIIPVARAGATVIIGSSQRRVADLVAGTVPHTRIEATVLSPALSRAGPRL
ncbi:MAG: uridylate kinase [Oscillospiraceae bacterium]|nr:uridylate kinase [Oscillospiraceae bacterium]